jgi:hypothetical protein
MKPELLHPAIVHLPLGIAIVLPVLGLLVVWLHFRRRDESKLVYKHKAASYLYPESETLPAATKSRKPQE